MQSKPTTTTAAIKKGMPSPRDSTGAVGAARGLQVDGSKKIGNVIEYGDRVGVAGRASPTAGAGIGTGPGMAGGERPARGTLHRHWLLAADLQRLSHSQTIVPQPSPVQQYAWHGE
ncbi:hypothetical protein Raf01_47790 [Rugosimonospora africana]|uniref:Uncharacterized protein n=1 Tax=Rugosimonospora africana TaxID=556532 RepID=A0A8J3QV02_9ACTN|nr:hypothetical protein Raf01_47790 [Rugosimonospora africana]